MKRNHKYISALFVSLLLAVPAYSQKVAADRLDQRLEMFDERLDLTDEQEAEIRDIWAQHRAEMQSWMAENGDATREERRNYFRERADAVHAEVEAVLTPEQVERLNAFRSSRRQGVRGRQDGRRGRSECCMRDGSRGRMEMRGRQGGGGAFGSDRGPGMHGGRGTFIDRFGDALDLSDAQREELQDIIESHQEEGRRWRQEHPNATRKQVETYHEGHFAQLKTELEHVLTPEQLDKFEELHESRRGDMTPRKGRQ